VADPHKQVDIFGLSATCPTAPRKSNPWNEFQQRAKGGQFRNSAEAAKAYRHFQRGEFDQMAQMLDFSSPHGKAVFWSGDLPAAQRYAAKLKGGTTMEETAGGRIFDKWDYLKQRYPEWDTNPNPALNQQNLWKAISKKYASEATGPVHYVHRYEGYIWKNVEETALTTQGNPIIRVKVP
jgi:hypothetical protein